PSWKLLQDQEGVTASPGLIERRREAKYERAEGSSNRSETPGVDEFGSPKTLLSQGPAADFYMRSLIPELTYNPAHPNPAFLMRAGNELFRRRSSRNAPSFFLKVSESPVISARSRRSRSCLTA